MSKNDVLKVLNLILAILLINQIVTGFMHDIIPKEPFEFLHIGGGILFTIGVIVHLFMNWSWIKFNFFTRKR